MEYIEAIRTALGDFWVALRNNTNHTSDISMLAVTALAAISTAFAAIATRNSTKVSEATLIHTQKTSRRDEFNSRYTLLLEQHKEQLNVVKSYLDKGEGKALLDRLIDETNHLTAFKTLQGHNILSPYMRVLYHLLRHIDVHYVENATTDDKKMYSSTVRSLIRNDVLFLVAVNASYIIEEDKDNDYGKYQKLLRDFDFFEHALFFSASDVTPGLKKDSVSIVRNNIIQALINNHSGNIIFDRRFYQQRNANFKIPFIISCIFKNPLNSESLECLNNIDILFKSEADKASQEKIAEIKAITEHKDFFNYYYHKKYIESTDSVLIEVDRTKRIDLILYKKLPEVDESYINNYLSALRTGDPSVLPNNCYIFTEGEDNYVHVVYPDIFRNECERLLKLQKHLLNVESRDADREFIQHELQRLSNFRSAVLLQRLTA